MEVGVIFHTSRNQSLMREMSQFFLLFPIKWTESGLTIMISSIKSLLQLFPYTVSRILNKWNIFFNKPRIDTTETRLYCVPFEG
jgi:hypothetical protein